MSEMGRTQRLAIDPKPDIGVTVENRTHRGADRGRNATQRPGEKAGFAHRLQLHPRHLERMPLQV